MFDEFTEDSTDTRLNDYIDLESLQNLGDWKELFLGLFDVARELFFILNEEGTIIIVNQSGAASLEYSVHQASFYDAKNEHVQVR